MNKMTFNKERMSVQIQRLLMMMVAIIVASMTITACLDDENSDDPDDNGDGGNGGGVSGKRLKTTVITCSKPLNQPLVRTEYSFNSDGTIKGSEGYDASSKRLFYSVGTNNSDGTIQKTIIYNNDGTVMIEAINSYNSNKTLQKTQNNYFNNGVISFTIDIEYKYENGKKIREEYYTNGVENANYKINYDNQGRRTTSIYTLYEAGQTFTMTYTRTYNSDGTIQKVTYPLSFVDNTTVTETFTWENGKTTYDFDMFSPY